MAAILPEQAASPIGVSGLRHANGIIDNEFLRELRGPRKYKTYQEMLANDETIGVSIKVFILLMRQVSWFFTPREESLEGQDAAEFASSIFFEDMRIPWRDAVTQALTMLPFGWSTLAINYKWRRGMNEDERQASLFDDGGVGIDSLEGRAQHTLSRWEFSKPDGRLLGWWQSDPTTGKLYFLPIERLAHFTMSQGSGNPEGESIIRHCVTTWYTKKKLIEYQTIGVSRDVAGIPVAKVPAEIMTDSAYAARKAEWQALVQGIRNNENAGLVIPLVIDHVTGKELYDLSLLPSAGSRQFDPLPIIQWLDGKMFMALLTDIVVMGHEQVGSFALASSKTNMLGLFLGSILDAIVSTVNTQIMPRLWRLNGRDMALMPHLQHGDIESLSLPELGAFVQSMASAGLDVLRHEEDIWQRAGFSQAPGA